MVESHPREGEREDQLQQLSQGKRGKRGGKRERNEVGKKRGKDRGKCLAESVRGGGGEEEESAATE
jgi:hypothetical protein